MADPSSNDEERALEPSEQRIRKAREEGQYPQSRDLTTLLVLMALAAFTVTLGPALFSQWVEVMRVGLIFGPVEAWTDHLASWAAGPLWHMVLQLIALMLPVWLISIFAPLALVRFQPVFAFRFNASRMDPLAGLGRMLSIQTLTELVKNLLKVIVIYGIGIAYLLSLFSGLSVFASQDLKQALAHTVTILQRGFLFLMMPLLLVAALDVFLQWFNFNKRMRMSRQEMKEEMKESEGSPEVRTRLRQRQRQIATTRMMAALEKADVVLVNPEHYAVALRYDAEKMSAPIVVAKGLDDLALRMQAIARDSQVPIARIPPLARLMHQRLKVGEAVPAQLFEAVAKILAWAYELGDKTAEESPPPDIGPLPALESPQT